MWAKIATFKENLSQIASDVQDTAEELDIEIGGGRPRVRISDTSASSDRSVERKFADVNGSDDSVRAELEWYKGEIQRLQKSEAEIQAMSVNYASLLKDREEELQKMHDNYEKLKKLKAGATEESQLLNSDKRESSQVMNGSKKQADVHTQGNQITQHGKNTNMGNGFSTEQEEKQLRMELLLKKLIEKEKELPQLLQEKSEAFVDLKNENEKLKNEIERLKASRGKDHAALLNSSSQVQRKPEHFHNTKKEWSELLAENQHMSKQIVDLQKKLNEKTVEVNKLNEKLRKGTIYPKEYVEKLQNSIATLEKEKTALKTENDGLLDKVSRHEQQSLRGKTDTDADRLADKSLEGSKEINTLTENGDLVGEASHLRILELEQSLQNAMKERDKALRDLSRLKQHLLAKEQEDTEKMDQDSERITELQAELDAKTRKILHLERTLDQAVASQEEVKRINTGELQRANEKISELQQKLAGCVSALEAKDTELQNLQTVLGQYYAEIESKERVYGELAAARDELSKLSQTMKELSQVIESRDKEKSELLEKLGFAERRLAETLQTRERLEDEIVRLRRALEQSMTRLNRMSVDSDYLVDRRIVIKLLVTYFQRQHSKEVLDLMVRILGFSDEDKQRIGIAQQVAGKGVVRGVLGLPGRLVGGILGSGTSDTSFSLPSENQSFSDLWIDFLLKESEEREKRENAEAHTTTSAISGNSMNSVNSTVASHSASPLIYSNVDRMTKIDASREVQWGSSADSEFSTVPLNSGNSYSSSSSIHQPRLAPK